MRDVIAYFSMEIGVSADLPTYSGGLGVLAGDTLKSAADLHLPVIGVTLLSRKGYFRQELAPDGSQSEHPVEWRPEEVLEPLDERVTVEIAGREVVVRAWRHQVKSPAGGTVPILFLDTDLEENDPEDRRLTDHLYGGDRAYRLSQEIVLGIGGVRLLREMEIRVFRYHLNEGHSALLTLELLQRYRRNIEEVWEERLTWDLEAVRRRCIFTTHTPVEAGHDKFDYGLVAGILGEPVPGHLLRELAGEDELNMTMLALNLSDYVNGVAKKHGEVSREMFQGYRIDFITNGIHSYTWTSDEMKALFDRYIPGWAHEPELLVRVGAIPGEELRVAHRGAKERLLRFVGETTGVALDPGRLTLGFARRATGYKRADLLLADTERLARIGDGKLQVIYAGKAHPADVQGKDLIRRIVAVAGELRGRVEIVYLPNYNMETAALLVAGVDLWLNTPLRPLEASGTSGMKAVHNGVPNFSVLDGWWVEGHIEGVTGWSIGAPATETTVDPSAWEHDAADLYRKLEEIIIPLYYDDPGGWLRVMRSAIGKNAYYFNSHRMMRSYVTSAYLASHENHREE